MDTVDEQKVNNTNDVKDFELLTEISKAKFVAGQQLLKQDLTQLSKRGILRALFAAINYNVNDASFKFEKEIEAKAGGLMAQILDLRNILLAAKLKDKDKQNIKQGDSSDGETR